MAFLNFYAQLFLNKAGIVNYIFVCKIKLYRIHLIADASFEENDHLFFA